MRFLCCIFMLEYLALVDLHWVELHETQEQLCELANLTRGVDNIEVGSKWVKFQFWVT